MTALTKDRNTPQKMGNHSGTKLAASMLVFAGSLLCRNGAGFAVKGTTAVGMVGIGVAQERVDNSSGADGDLNVLFEAGTWRFVNSAGVDEITQAEIGDVCFVVDDQTVAKTDATATRSPAGIVDAVDGQGVWVRFDEALTKAAV